MKMIIGGIKVDSRSKETVDVICPSDGKFLDVVPVATEEDVKEAIETAKKGQKLWSKVSLYERERILKRYIELVDENKEGIAEILSLEQGRPYQQNLSDMYSQVNNILPTYIDAYKHFHGKTTQPGAYSFNKNDFQVVVREPVGVVAAIIAYNSPVTILYRKVIPALITGNAIVVKPATDAPLAVIRCMELLVEAGVTPEAINLVTGSGSKVGKWISENPHVNTISFTGSTEVGIDIIQKSSVNLTRCHLELGGNDAFIILEDADIDLAVKSAYSGRIPVSGQICASPKRFIVDKKIVEEFTDKLIAAISKVTIGQPMDENVELCGLINEKAAIQALEQVEYTVKQGAKIALGGERHKAVLLPTVLTDVTKDMDIAQSMEVFAPVFPIIVVENEEEAVEIANNTHYGLSGSVFSKDMRRAMHIANQLETGQVVINSHGWYLNPDQPFGGYKKSGLGREGVEDTLSAFTQEKTITFKDYLY